ncbi:MAG TPA: hypothetical protein ENH46_03000, partial [Candidatus Pacearchaeota archaeon]|nr:hypothetical protein [Candidatus Pacearchaeota archaeon]
MQQENKTESGKNWHDKYYMMLLLIPLLLLAFSLVYLYNFYQVNDKNIMYKDVSLTGGTAVTIYEKINIDDLESSLSDKLEEMNIREVYDLVTKEQKAVIIETKTKGNEAKQILEEYLGYELVAGENSDFEFTGSTLSENFYKQLLISILFAFVFMAIVVFILFRTIVPSSAVILSAFADIVMTLALVNILGMKMSSAGIVA